MTSWKKWKVPSAKLLLVKNHPGETCVAEQILIFGVATADMWPAIWLRNSNRSLLSCNVKRSVSSAHDNCFLCLTNFPLVLPNGSFRVRSCEIPPQNFPQSRGIFALVKTAGFAML